LTHEWISSGEIRTISACYEQELIKDNPCKNIKRWGGDDRPKTPKVIPSQEQILKMFLAAGEYKTFLLALFSLTGPDQ
jgi:hypothetical protein